jgi:anti-sigma B factor antagonist
MIIHQHYNKAGWLMLGKKMEITTTMHDGAMVLAVTGRVDTTTAGELEASINLGISNGFRQILLDFGGVTYISSVGLRVLLATAKKLRNDGDRYALCALSMEVQKVLKLAGFTSIFSIYASQEDALAAW